MGPDQYPQYTRAWLAREAVGSSQKKHHSTPQHTTSTTHEPNVHPTKDERLAW